MPKFTQITKNTIFCEQKHRESLGLTKASAKQLKSEIQLGKIGAFLHLQGNREEFLGELNVIADKIKKFPQILVIGVGGSSLGAKTFCALANKFNSTSELRFLESIDPSAIRSCLDWIDWQNCFFLIISKSGETIETTCHTLLVLELLQQKFPNNAQICQRLLFITESAQNTIGQIAKKIGAEIFPHPTAIGGRFSCFSVVGFLPVILAGVDANKLFLGANEVLNEFLSEETKNCEITEICAAQIAMFEHGIVNHVLMPYIDSFHRLAEWFRQLWAESLGKGGFGFTPINSQGTIDQHSQLQLYLDGPKDKFFNFITKKSYSNNFLISDQQGVATIFGGKKLSQIIAVEEESTIELLCKKGLPVRQFIVESEGCFEIAGLMMQMMLETLIIAKAKQINPFDQPLVEERKKIAREILIQS